MTFLGASGSDMLPTNAVSWYKQCGAMHPIPFQPAHPVSFLPLVSFGSLLPVKSPVTLERRRDRQQCMDSGRAGSKRMKCQHSFSLPWVP